MKKFVCMIMVVIIFGMLCGCSSTQESQLSTKEKVADFKYMYNTIKEGYPYLEVNKRLNGVDWIENKDEYLEKIKSTENDEEFLNVMTDIVMDLNNAHTHIVNDERTYKFIESVYSQSKVYDFLNDKKVVDRYKAIGNNDEIIKKPIIKKDITVKDVIDGKVAYIHLPQMYMVSDEITEKDIEDDMKIIDDYVRTLENHQALIIDIRGNSGGCDNYWLNIVSKITKKDIENKGYMVFRNDSEVMKSYINKRGLKLEPIEKLPKDIQKNAPKEVMGVFSEFNEMTREVPTDYRSKFEGKVYLLVDEAVYSSAETFAIFCKDTRFATLIGERTGGDGGGIDPILFKLENSGIIVRMSSDMYLNNRGICNEEFKTEPDYIIDDVSKMAKFEDDKCIQKVLELENIKVGISK